MATIISSNNYEAKMASSSHTLSEQKGNKVTPRRPSGQPQFDSLQNLLEEAGYKETRIFTPVQITQSKKSSKSIDKPDSSTLPSSNALSSSGSDRSSFSSIVMTPEPIEEVGYIDNLKSIASNSSWFQTSWNPVRKQSQNSKQTGPGLRKKQSEPAFTDTLRRKSWSSWFGQSSSIQKDECKEQVGPFEQQVVENTKASSSSKVQSDRPQLRHAPSTKDLWKASMRHHRESGNGNTKPLHKSRSFPARPTHDVQSEKKITFNRKPSYDGARVVTSVGVRAAGALDLIGTKDVFIHSEKRRISLRQAFCETEELEKEKKEESKDTSSSSDSPNHHRYANRQEWRDSVSSLSDLEEINVKKSLPKIDIAVSNPLKEEKENVTPRLFSTIAHPIVSMDDAVAMRNVGCLEFGVNGSDFIVSPGDEPGPSNRLRKMRSVDALVLALARMQSKKNLFGIHSVQQTTIPESFSADSLTQEDFANAQTTKIHSDQEEVLNDITNESDFDKDDGIRRCPTPTLMITSPTGDRPPQPLVLDGVEFEPRSVSPKGMIQPFARPIPRRGGWKIPARPSRSERASQNMSTDDTDDARGRSHESKGLNEISTNILSSSNKKKGGLTKPKAVKANSSNHLQSPLIRKPKKTKSCSNLDQAAAESIRSELRTIRNETGKLTGSEQVRALQKSVEKRERNLIQNASQIIPSSPTEMDDDDPFNDFLALACKTQVNKKPEPNSAVKDAAQIHRDRSKMSPVPFERERSPLGENKDLSNSSNDLPNPDPISNRDKSKTKLNKKTSGVGLACLVNLDQEHKSNLGDSKVLQIRARKSSLLNQSKRTSIPTVRPTNAVEQIMNENQPVYVGDENVNTLLDSPSARAGHRVIAKKRSTGQLRSNLPR